MSRDPQKDAEVRESSKKRILDAALTVYIRCGYHGADMAAVAAEAQLAKGLVYYYYKTKNELFAELYTWMFNEGYSFSETLLKNTEGLDPVEQLMAYAYGMFAANRDNPRMMQFFIRVPFDAYAIFGAERWKDGAQKSGLHKRALEKIIENGVAQGLIPGIDPSGAANSFWSVFVANVFEYSKLMAGTQPPLENEPAVFKNVVRFCFQGLGVEYDLWNPCLKKITVLNKKEGNSNEGL